jgi:hypothetical protein
MTLRLWLLLPRAPILVVSIPFAIMLDIHPLRDKIHGSKTAKAYTLNSVFILKKIKNKI